MSIELTCLTAIISTLSPLNKYQLATLNIKRLPLVDKSTCINKKLLYTFVYAYEHAPVHYNQRNLENNKRKSKAIDFILPLRKQKNEIRRP